MDIRYLTPEAKERELTAWQRLRMGFGQTLDVGGKGFPDRDIITWCEEINKFPGVCTLQSCSGHAAPADGGGPSSGHVWLWFDRAMSEAFDRDGAFDLSKRQDVIDQVIRMYTSWGQEIVAITFAGNERRKLDESMQAIISLLRSLASTTYSRQVPALSLAKHSLSNSPVVGLV